MVMGNQLGTSPPDIRNPMAVKKKTTTRTEVSKPARCDVLVISVTCPHIASRPMGRFGRARLGGAWGGGSWGNTQNQLCAFETVGNGGTVCGPLNRSFVAPLNHAFGWGINHHTTDAHVRLGLQAELVVAPFPTKERTVGQVPGVRSKPFVWRLTITPTALRIGQHLHEAIRRRQSNQDNQRNDDFLFHSERSWPNS